MMHIFLDTNIVIDLLSKRPPFFKDAQILFSSAKDKNLVFYISSLTFANANYVISKGNSINEIRTILRNLRLLLKIVHLTDEIINLALNDFTFPDFEDGLQYYSALEANCDYIITRDLKDFKNSKLPVMTAKSFIISK
ncbi:type II toxin-antitoxin system VapC family toxin [Polaribacter sp. R77954]|uniref:type II toxin-antitoxin system VapC family toxin n=1 Tax=Polaribacter sp. R77954 TaxID=3093870 RepID=UPI0037C8CAC0